MSRREGRDFDSRRHRSRFDQEPSPKRSKRDGKPETERPVAALNLHNQDHPDRDQKLQRRLQDALPFEAPSTQVSSIEAVAMTKESEKPNVDCKGSKYSSDPMDVPRSRSYIQHEERGSARQVGRGFSRGAPSDRGWWRDAKEHQNERGNRTSTSDLQEKDERARVRREGNGAWRHDRYSEMEKEPKPNARKRSFREKKDPDETEKAAKAVEIPVKPNPKEHPVLETDGRDERVSHISRHAEQTNRANSWDKDISNGERWRGYSSSRDRYGTRSGNYQGRDRFTSRGSYRQAQTGGRIDKWKHDLYDEANRSPSPKNEESAVAKVEALLAS